MKNDPALDAVRRARSEISRELGNDPVQLIAHYVELQAHFKGRLIHGPEGADAWEDTAQQANAPDSRPPSPTARSDARG